MKKAMMMPAALLLCVSLGVSATAEEKVEVNPGLYAYTTTVDVGPQNVVNDSYEYCIFEGNNSRSFDELMTDWLGDTNCDVTNSSFGGGKGSATVSCANTDLGVPINGTIEGYYSRTSYGGVTKAKSPMGGMEITVKTTAKRMSDCPAGWTPPEGYSDED